MENKEIEVMPREEVSENTEPTLEKLPYEINMRDGSTVSDETLNQIYNDIKDFNKLQTIRYFTRAKNDIDMCKTALEFIQTAASTKEAVETFTASLDDAKANSALSKKIDDLKETLENSKDFDSEALTTEVNEYVDQLEAAINIAKAHLKHLKEVNGDTCMAEDIIDTLLKNQQTLRESNNPNAPLFIKSIDEAIIEVSDIGLTGKMSEESLRRLKSKLEVPKRIVELAKVAYTDKRNCQRALRKAGFETRYIEEFIKFMMAEKHYSENILGEDSGISDDMIMHTSMLFFYHLAKIVEAEIPKRRYKTLVFKMYALRVLEIASAFPITNNAVRTENGVETEASAVRQSTYKIYLEILKKYDLPRVREYAKEASRKAEIEKAKKINREICEAQKKVSEETSPHE